MNFERQTTLKNRVFASGVGVHSNAAATIILNPAEADTGIVFQRMGSRRGPRAAVPARWSQVTMTELCTTIGDGAQGAIATVEHLLAALLGLGIDNVLVEIDGPEVPAMDGSAAAFVDMIDTAGIETLSAPRRYIRILKPVRVSFGEAFCELRPHESGLRLDVDIDFPSAAIGHQARAADLVSNTFRRDLARARTFGFLADVERLWKAGFARGASLENTIAVQSDRVLNPEGLRYADEFVRHKMLDAVGDLALAGARILGLFRSHCGGHRLNVAVLKALFLDCSAFEWVEAAHVSPSLEPEYAPLPLYVLPFGDPLVGGSSLHRNATATEMPRIEP
jgi:UDP-3-O-[3-hydroxymyristoyl] N-acetylglucosamine deacetylase